MINKLRLALRHELESDTRAFGSGWLSGVAAFVLALAGLFGVLGARYPQFFSMKELSVIYSFSGFTLALQIILLAAFMLACCNLVLRRNKMLGFTAIFIVLGASLLGATTAAQPNATSHLFGLDWFALNILFTGLLFVPLEKLFGRLKEQALFRTEWREDLFYFFLSSLLVQSLTYLSLAPSMAVLAHTSNWADFRAMVASQPIWLQFIEVMFLTDFVQYWFHRAFHKIPFLWGFHAVHHSAKAMDWLAGSRMHIVEIIGLRGLTIIPMYSLGFSETALHAYILTVYVYATYIHANLRFNVEFLKKYIVTPRFHHWHHGIEKEAIDVNFAIHFPLFDRLFGTYYMPEKVWPSGYGVGGYPVPNGYLSQLAYPFKR